MISRRRFAASLPFATSLAPAAVGPPAPYGAIPSERQLHWHEMEFYGFLHFTINTFTDKEWGYGDESPNLFAPTDFDANRLVEPLAAAGMKGVILTCKHHDGFCLWPTKTTEHCVRNSAWRNGKGDAVREISDAARGHGMKFGVYLSPWDRNSAQYGHPEYIEIYRAQLRELLTQYGPIYEVWHDGANGGDGYYGGAREKRQIDRKTYYDWPNTWELTRSLQPGAVIFSDVGPDIRWVGNEKGFANETCWATMDPAGRDGGPAAPGDVRDKELTSGHRNGKRWLPAECDVSIRPGWFWHEKENGRVKSPETLMDLYFKSVGRGASFLLNVPPDRRGLLHETDVASLRGFGDLLRKTFGANLAAKARAAASNVRGRNRTFRAENVLDGRRETFWTTDDNAAQPELTLDLRQPATFNVIRIREHLPLGQRIDSVALDAWRQGGWREIAQATSIGACRLIKTAAPVTAPKVRLRVTKSSASPAISEVALFNA